MSTILTKRLSWPVFCDFVGAGLAEVAGQGGRDTTGKNVSTEWRRGALEACVTSSCPIFLSVVSIWLFLGEFPFVL
jgi:hypothetical protein